MTPGNAPALHSSLADYAEYADFPVALGDSQVTIHHAQFAKYPVERAARALHDGLSITPSEFDDYDGFRDAIFEDVHDEAERVIEETPGLGVGLHDERYFEAGQYIDTTDLHGEVTRLTTMYDGFEPPEGEEHHYERYGESRRIPETRAELVADLLTLYNVQLAEKHIHDLRYHCHGEEWTEDEALAALYAMRDLVERSHGWSVFAAPSPSEAEIEELWEMREEVGFPKAIDWVYALYILPHGAKYYEVTDALDRKMSYSIGSTMSGMMGGRDPELQWAAEGTTPADLDEHREEMRDQWEAEVEE